MKVLGTTAVGKEVGQGFRQIAMLVIIAASICILIYLWFRFELVFGVAAVVALIHDLTITLGIITLLGSIFVVYFSANAKALDTIDFWAGTFLIFVLATIEIIVFSWVVGLERGMRWAHEGAAIRIPRLFQFIMRWVSPFVLLAIFAMWVLSNIFGVSFRRGQEAEPSEYLKDLFYEPNPVAWMSLLLIFAVGLFALVLTTASARFRGIENIDTEQRP